MCGITGMAGNNLTFQERKAFKDMLALDVLRGKDSTGVAVVNSRGNWDVVKRKGTAWDLFETKAFDDVMRFQEYVYIGHNRAATKGKVNNINAHPFEFEDVVGVHNGTIRGQHRLIDNAQFEVDSENIFHSIQQIGLRDTLDVLDGAYCLNYWDKRDETLVLLRNEERPMFFAFSEDKKNVFWASEAWIISAALSRNGVKYTKIHELTKNSIYRFHIDRRIKGADIDLRVQAFTPFVAPRAAYNTTAPKSSGQSKNVFKPKELGFNPNEMLQQDVEFTIDGVRHGLYGSEYIQGTVKSKGIEVRFNSFGYPEIRRAMIEEKDVSWTGYIRSYGQDNGSYYFNLDPRTVELVEMEEIVLGFEDKPLNEEEFHKITDKGCAWCSEPPSFEEAEELEWISHNSHVCKSCQENDEVRGYLTQAS